MFGVSETLFGLDGDYAVDYVEGILGNFYDRTAVYL